MTTIDSNKTIWRVNGRIKDGRRQTTFVNAIDKATAYQNSKSQGFTYFESAQEINLAGLQINES